MSSNLVLNAFPQSSMDQAFKKLGYEYPEYVQYKSMPPHTTEIMKTPPRNEISGTLAGKVLAFDVPRYGHWMNAVVKYNFTTATALLADSPIGLTLAQTITVESANRTLFVQSDLYAIARAQHSHVGKAAELYRLAYPLSATTYLPQAATVNTSFCAVHCSFFEDPRNFFDLSRNESLRVVVTVNTANAMGITAAQTISALSAELYTWHVKYDNETEKVLVQMNRNPDVPSQQFGIDTFTESVVSTGTPAFLSILMNSDVPVRTTYLRLKDGADTETAGDSIAFTSYTIKINGQIYHDNIPKIVGNFISYSQGNSAGIVAGGDTSAVTVRRVEQDVLAINWGTNIMDRTMNSGFLPLVALNRAEVILFSPSIVATTSIEYCNEYEVQYSIDASNGVIAIYTSS
jgi:hypothetical protein